MIKLTDSAIKHLKEFSEAEGIGHLNVRVFCKGGGCGGMMFDMLFEELPPTELDEVFEQEKICVIIDCISLTYMKGEIILDWVDGEFGSGFKFVMDDSYKSCGCKESFSI